MPSGSWCTVCAALLLKEYSSAVGRAECEYGGIVFKPLKEGGVQVSLMMKVDIKLGLVIVIRSHLLVLLILCVSVLLLLWIRFRRAW